MKSITVVAGAGGSVDIIDPFPNEGMLSVSVPVSTSKTFTCTTAQYNRIKTYLDAQVSAGAVSSYTVNETDAERTDLFMETKKVASPAVRSGYGRFYTGTDGKPYFKQDNGTVWALGFATGTDTLIDKGTVGVATDFPLIADVVDGWLYRVTADVTDNGGATRTNTGQSFLKGDEIYWMGTAWVVVGRQEITGFVAATPTTLGDGDSLAMIDSVTIAGPAVVNLPAATVGRVGKRIIVVDANGAVTPTNHISVTPNGTDTIDGVNAAVDITSAYGGYIFTCIQTGAATYGWSTGSGLELRTATARLATIGAGSQIFADLQAVAADATTVVFRALAPGKITAFAAETGTVAAAAESMSFDIKIGGVSALTAAVVVDSTVLINTPVAGVIDTAHNTYAAGDQITIVRDYTAGGGPTPMANTRTDLLVKLS